MCWSRGHPITVIEYRLRVFCIKTQRFPRCEGPPGHGQASSEDSLSTETKKDEGRLKATFERSQLKTLEGIAQDIWSIYYEFNQYMNNS